MIDLNTLREQAKAATKGEWAVDGYNMAAVIFRQHGKTNVTDWMRLVRCDEDNANWKADADYIAAASPSTLLSLISELEQLRAEKEAMRGILQNAKGFLDTPITRRRFGGNEFYAELINELRAALPSTSTEGGTEG
ncbi:MAG TPA: ead/Ea22-like family protein [Opitutaceae bacterium]